MSHISKIEIEVKDLGTLKQACNRLGLELIEGQKTFKWYGREEGACDHAIRVQKARYEIGVVKKASSYELQCDYFDSAIGQAIGQNGGLLKQAYAVEKTKIEARLKGYSVIEKTTNTGIQLRVLVALAQEKSDKKRRKLPYTLQSEFSDFSQWPQAEETELCHQLQGCHPF